MFQTYDLIHRDRAQRFEAEARASTLTSALRRAARLERTARLIERGTEWADGIAMRLLERAHDRRAPLGG